MKCLIGCLLLLSICLQTGCGTVFTRLGRTSFGGYPYAAVATVGEVLVARDADCGERLGAAIDLPFDFALDTLFLFPDLVMWSCGQYKGDLGDYIH